MHDQARPVVKDLLASHSKDPSVVATEKMKSLKLDLSAATLEVDMGSRGLAVLGLSLTTPQNYAGRSVIYVNWPGPDIQAAKGVNLSPPALAEFSRGGSCQIGVQK